MSVSILGGFLVVHEQSAVAIDHIKRLHAMGRENVDQPTARDVHLAADLGQDQAEVILGRFRNFREAETAMRDILRDLESRRAVSIASSLSSLSGRLSDLEEKVHDMDQLGPVR